MPIEVVTIKEKLGQFTDYWNPRIIGELNGQHVKLSKFKGEFIWHQHEREDEMFLVISGNFIMELRDTTLHLKEGDFVIIPKGTDHKPVAPEEVHVMLFEPASTLNTGNAENELTRQVLEKI
jgi:mannose-6-phosphate isomerase-like protein (cupin superfamily)